MSSLQLKCLSGTKSVSKARMLHHQSLRSLPGDTLKDQSGAGYLDVVALEQVQVCFGLTRLFTHQSQDGVEAAVVHHSLTVLDRPDGEVLQLVLKQKQQVRRRQASPGVAGSNLR